MHKSGLTLSFTLFIFLFIASCSNQAEWQNEFSVLKKQLAPDSRVAIFEYQENAEGTWVFKTNQQENVPALTELVNKYGLNSSQIELLPKSPLAEKPFGIVLLSVANMRKNPAESSELTTQTIMGTVIKVFEKKNGWVRVQTPDSYIGWMDDASFIQVDETGLNAWLESPKVVFLPNYGHLNETKTDVFSPITDLTAGNLLTLISQEKTHLKVATPDGRQGFIPVNAAQLSTDWKNKVTPTATQILNTAKLFNGVPYLWGGTSFKGVDCSGFTKMTFFMNGIQLPRDASQQVHVGEAVETDTTFNKVQPGDLLFFGTKATADKPERVVHVGIYMGDGKMIHSSGRVRIESLKRGEPTFNAYRLTSFLRAKRILTKIDSDGIPSIKTLKYY